VKLPTGYFITYGGQFESQESATRLIAILSLFSLAAMFLVLFAHFRSVPIVLQILLNIPPALVGGGGAVVPSGGPFSVAAVTKLSMPSSIGNGVAFFERMSRAMLGRSLRRRLHSGGIPL